MCILPIGQKTLQQLELHQPNIWLMAYVKIVHLEPKQQVQQQQVVVVKVDIL